MLTSERVDEGRCHLRTVWKNPVPCMTQCRFILINPHGASARSVPGPIWALGLQGQDDTGSCAQGAQGWNNYLQKQMVSHPGV